jgi:hypothetical protein
MNKELCLVFIDNVGTNLDDKYVYQLYFSETPEVVWGEFWNVCPCSIVPVIHPDLGTISQVYEVELDHEISIVTQNSCFSMQDCIDGIISLGWIDFSERIMLNDKLIKFDFGEHFEDTESKVQFLGSKMKFLWEKQDNSEEDIDNLIDKLGGGINDEW